MQLRNYTLGILVFLVLWIGALNAQTKEASGVIKGQVLDQATREPLAGVNIEVLDTQLGAATDMEGIYTIPGVPVGNYRLRISYIGYDPLIKTDIIVRPDRTTFFDTELKESYMESEAIAVTADYFSQVTENPVSLVNFDAEEIRRAPGSAGDVSRIIYGLPSVAKFNDTKNSLIVRGGSAMENSFYLDNIEITNINHFPEQGSSGGPIGMINVDLIRDVNFYAGAFDATYGDRLSSVMELRFREGDRDSFNGQLDLGLSGLGGVAEGPLFNQKGSWLVAAKRSYLDLIVGAIGETNTSVPQYSDLQFKLVYDPAPEHRLTMIGLTGWDEISLNAADAVANEANMYNEFSLLQNTIGLDWRYLWSGNGYSNTSLSHALTKYRFDLKETWYFAETGNEKTLLKQVSGEQEIRLRNVNHYRPSKVLNFDFGIEFKYVQADYDNYYGSYFDHLGNPTPALSVLGISDAYKLHGFFGLSWSPFAQLTIKPGVRIGHFTYNEQTNFSPRFAATYQVLENTSLNFSTGIFYQNLPLILLTQNEANKQIKDPTATHLVFGIRQLLTENTQLTLELYNKEYTHLPVDPSQPELFLMDEVSYNGLFLTHGPLQDGGKASSRGVEIMVQKKLAESVYGMASASWYRSFYQDFQGIQKARIYDNRLTFNIEGGYKPNKKWEFSLRWIYAGGAPYTPLDEAASAEADRGIYDNGSINAMRLPAYHSLNLRADRRIFFEQTNIVLYLSIWNVYGRENISGYSWNQIAGKKEPITQWGTLPILGVEYEF